MRTVRFSINIKKIITDILMQKRISLFYRNWQLERIIIYLERIRSSLKIQSKIWWFNEHVYASKYKIWQNSISFIMFFAS